MSRQPEPRKRVVIESAEASVVVEHRVDGQIALFAAGVDLTPAALFRLLGELGWAMARVPLEATLQGSTRSRRRGS